MSEIREKIKEKFLFYWKYERQSLIKVIAAITVFLSVFLFFLAERIGVSVSQHDQQAEGAVIGARQLLAFSEQNVEREISKEAIIYIDVAGAVVKPGVVKLPTGSRVFSAIEKAGGLLSDADTTEVNLAAVLSDGDKLLIPKIAGDGQNEKSEKSGGIIRSTNLININQATKEQLTELSGIGPATAERIVDYRSKNGKFQSTEELLNVKGIGEKTLGKIKERLCI